LIVLASNAFGGVCAILCSYALARYISMFQLRSRKRGPIPSIVAILFGLWYAARCHRRMFDFLPMSGASDFKVLAHYLFWLVSIIYFSSMTFACYELTRH